MTRKVINSTFNARIKSQFIDPILEENSMVDVTDPSIPQADELSIERSNESDEEVNFNYEIGEPGFVDAANYVKDLAGQGYGVVDILLNINERFDKELGEKVMNHARDRGWL
jgi:hypothetical protein